MISLLKAINRRASKVIIELLNRDVDIIVKNTIEHFVFRILMNYSSSIDENFRYFQQTHDHFCKLLDCLLSHEIDLNEMSNDKFLVC